MLDTECRCNMGLFSARRANRGFKLSPIMESPPSRREFSAKSNPVFLIFLLISFAILLVISHRAFRDSIKFSPQLTGPAIGSNNNALQLQGDEIDSPFWKDRSRSRVLVIQDVVILGEEVLLLIRLPESYAIAGKQELSCIFGNRSSSSVVGIDEIRGRTGVRCKLPRNQNLNGEEIVLEIEREGESVPIAMSDPKHAPIVWSSMVFEALTTAEDVVLFAKGIVSKQGHIADPKFLKCIFDGRIETQLAAAAQEVFRCNHPAENQRKMLAGKKISLISHGKIMPSVAYYEELAESAIPTNGFSLWSLFNKGEEESKQYFLCACTMMFNGAKFLKEWAIYHSYLGIQHFILYDNNSEDNLEEQARILQQFNISRFPWPWTKTQEAGFSHCALKSSKICSWMAYIDVDEFIYPDAWIKRRNSKSGPILHNLIEEIRSMKSVRGKNVGQISMACRNFGPSGLNHHPETGVTQGYTCRAAKEERHKSIVRLDAIDSSLLNIVHHFELGEDFFTYPVPTRKGVINHYKYQVWEEFRTKFRRRVSAFVTDWKEKKNLKSKDRAPGLGTSEIEPKDWKRRFCDLNDTALRNYVGEIFGHKNSDSAQFPWQ